MILHREVLVAAARRRVDEIHDDPGGRALGTSLLGEQCEYGCGVSHRTNEATMTARSTDRSSSATLMKFHSKLRSSSAPAEGSHQSAWYVETALAPTRRPTNVRRPVESPCRPTGRCRCRPRRIARRREGRGVQGTVGRQDLQELTSHPSAIGLPQHFRCRRSIELPGRRAALRGLHAKASRDAGAIWKRRKVRPPLYIRGDNDPGLVPPIGPQPTFVVVHPHRDQQGHSTSDGG